jgi:tetratricopeptide (TPR) repeat protein
MKKEVEKYKSHLENIKKSNPNNIDALIKLGILEFEYFHNHENAIAYFEKAIQLDPKSIDARFWLSACLYYDFGEYEKAEPYLKEALQLDPNRPECLSLMASIISGTHRPILNAIPYIQKAIRLAPDWPSLRYQLAELLLALGDGHAAEQEANIALHIIPLSPESITNEVDRYYETVITGRAWKNLDEEFRPILEQVHKFRAQ